MAEMPPSVVPSAAGTRGTSSSSKTAPGKQPCCFSCWERRRDSVRATRAPLPWASRVIWSSHLEAPQHMLNELESRKQSEATAGL